MIYLNGEEIAIERFHDGAPANTIAPQGKRCLIEWRYEDDSEAMFLWYLVHHLREGATNAEMIELMLPYLPTARADRCKYEEDVFYLKYFAKFINSLHFDSVWCVDIHSTVGEALIDNLVVLSPELLIYYTMNQLYKQYKIEKPLIYLTDSGSLKKFNSMLHTSFIFGIKERNWATHQITNLRIEKSDPDIEIEGRDILIVDDILASGRTILTGAQKLKELGANRIFIYVSHCENQVLDSELLKSGLIEKIFTTNSIFTSPENDDRFHIIDYKSAQAYRGHTYRR